VKCLSPLVIPRKDKLSKDGYHSEKVPCGRCPNCLKKRSSEWIFRLCEEQRTASSALFLTLTYDDDNLNYTKSGLQDLRLADYQLFMKRLRAWSNRKAKSNNQLKYYGCGEYGSTSQRPHFHSILFNLPRSMQETYFDRKKGVTTYPVLDHLWSKGHVYVGVSTPASMAYVTGYLQKHIGQDRTEQDDRNPERSFMSKGLGSGYLKPGIVEYYKRKLEPYLVGYDGQKLSMPRYYKNKLYTEDEMLQVNLKAKAFALDNDPFNGDLRQEFEYFKNQIEKRERLARIKRQKL
jgi:hypothetical protein